MLLKNNSAQFLTTHGNSQPAFHPIASSRLLSAKTLFSKNDYNTDFVRWNTHSDTDSNTQNNVNSGPVIRQRLSAYIRGTSDTIAHILQPHNIRVAHKPISTLLRLLTNVKDRDKPEDRHGTGSSIQNQMLRLPGYLHW